MANLGAISSNSQVSLTADIISTLPVTNGGTGATTSSGSGAVVLATSPTITTPTIASFANATHNHQASAGGGTLDAAAIASGSISHDRLPTTAPVVLNAYKTADESVTNSTTPQDDDHLSLSLAASSKYRFEIFAPWTTAATAGLKTELSGTVGVTNLIAEIQMIDTALNQLAAEQIVTALETGDGSGIGGGANHLLKIKGAIETSTAGTLVLQWAQNAADAVNATIVKRGAFMAAVKIG